MAVPATGHTNTTDLKIGGTTINGHMCLGEWQFYQCEMYNKANIYGYRSNQTIQEHGGNFITYVEGNTPTIKHTPAAEWTIKKNHRNSKEFTHSMVLLCTECGAILKEKIIPHEHTWNEFESKPKYDDCKHGKIYKRSCTAPGCEATELRVDRAPGHEYVQHVAKAPTCTEGGWDAYKTCTRCDYTTKVEKGVLGHNLEHHEAKAPSCTEAGWDAYETCTRCDYTTKVEKPALGHVPGEWIVEKEATETEDGYRYKKCTVCEEKVAEEVIPKLVWVNPFEDVTEDKWFYASVKYANQNNLFKGTSDTTFEPNTPMNRAMFCRGLANLEGVDNDNNLTVDRFSDVLSGKWYTKAVKWAADTGIVSGYPGGIFLPEQKITRQEMCLMLANYAKYLGIYDDLAKKEDNGVAFADAAKIATWASEAVNVMKNNGYIVGKPIDGTYEFQPQATATRAEVATIFRAFCMANPTVLKK